jgi:ferritin-like metal-binding protein YciE
MELPSQTLNSTALHTVFIKQLNTLYNAKISLIKVLPHLIEQATFNSLKFALREDLDETIQQMSSLKAIFTLVQEVGVNDSCLDLNAIIAEAHRQVFYDKHKHFESDMSILFYMSVIFENIQIGACQLLNLITLKLEHQPYAKLVRECLDTVKDNCSLFYYVTEEYIQN